jgi:hypothetical protein
MEGTLRHVSHDSTLEMEGKPKPVDESNEKDEKVLPPFESGSIPLSTTPVLISAATSMSLEPAMSNAPSQKGSETEEGRPRVDTLEVRRLHKTYAYPA